MLPIEGQRVEVVTVCGRAADVLAGIVATVETAYGLDSHVTLLAVHALQHARSVLSESAGEPLSALPVRTSLARLHELPRVSGRLSLSEHERLGHELKLLQNSLTRLCVRAEGRRSSAMGPMASAPEPRALDHALRRLRRELDRHALRELPRPALARAVGCYYGEPASEQRA
jgi:hypothetical protein